MPTVGIPWAVYDAVLETVTFEQQVHYQNKITYYLILNNLPKIMETLMSEKITNTISTHYNAMYMYGNEICVL